MSSEGLHRNELNAKITPLCLIFFFFVLLWLPSRPVASAVIFMSFCHLNIKMFSHSGPEPRGSLSEEEKPEAALVHRAAE